MPTATVSANESPTMSTRSRLPAWAKLVRWTACHSAALAAGPSSPAGAVDAAVACPVVAATTTATVTPTATSAGPADLTVRQNRPSMTGRSTR